MKLTLLEAWISEDKSKYFLYTVLWWPGQIDMAIEGFQGSFVLPLTSWDRAPVSEKPYCISEEYFSI